MAASVIVDASFLVTLLNRRETNNHWAADKARQYPAPWKTCDAVISETFHLVGPSQQFATLLRRGAIVPAFHFAEATETVLRLMDKYSDVPMSFADACLVHMSEVLPDPIILTTDTDFRVYRRNNRQVVPCVMPD